jgi:hypothetical protein
MSKSKIEQSIVKPTERTKFAKQHHAECCNASSE